MIVRWTAEDAARSLTAPSADDHKYRRGVVGMRTGSDAYPGAAVLGVEAAWRTGVGMVRYLGPVRAADLVLARRPETVAAPGRVQAWVVGSGTDPAQRTAPETAALRRILGGDVPVVVDAGALDLVPGATARVIVTPHDREHDGLRSALGLGRVDPAGGDGARAAACAETAARLGAVVLLKGGVTFAAAPDGPVHRIDAGTPWLATAGTGDVLAGAVGAVVAGLAARRDPDLTALADAAATASWLHARAGVLAAQALGPAGGPITALDVAEALPRAVAETLAG
ncbi:ADP-dependent NAD(P)H-hydrate dehydratase [Microbacterium sp. GXF7504]